MSQVRDVVDNTVKELMKSETLEHAINAGTEGLRMVTAILPSPEDLIEASTHASVAAKEVLFSVVSLTEEIPEWFRQSAQGEKENPRKVEIE